MDVQHLDAFHSDLTHKVRELVLPIRSEARQETQFHGFQELLHTKKELHRITVCSTANIFRSWSLILRINKARSRIRQHRQHQRRDRRRQLMHQAKLAADAKDQYALFSHIRRITPKVPRRHIRLRGPDGQLLGPSEAADAIEQWLFSIYHDSDASQSATLLQAYEWPFDWTDLYRCCRQFENTKALNPDFIPCLLWNAFAYDLAVFVDNCARNWSQRQPPQAPSLWRRGTLYLLSKPQKKGGSPDSLRPIALLEPTGKSIMGALAAHLLRDSQHQLTPLPQFAYMQNCGCCGAISRVLKVMDVLLHNLSMIQYKHHQHAFTTPPAGVWGGIIVSLDLTKAFDCVNRCLLYKALADFGISWEHIQVLQSVNANTVYQFIHRNIQRRVPTTKGIRQGCKAAPCLWLLYLGHLMHELANLSSWHWLQVFNTVFADDWTFHADLYTVEDLEQHLINVGLLFDLLETYGLPLNVSKTVSLMKAAGPDLRKLNRKFVHRTGHTAGYTTQPRSNHPHQIGPTTYVLGHLLEIWSLSASHHAAQTIMCSQCCILAEQVAQGQRWSQSETENKDLVAMCVLKSYSWAFTCGS